VLLPGTCFFLRELHRSPVAKMRKLGVCDGGRDRLQPRFCPLLAQPLAAQFGCVYYGMTIEEALRGITVSAAKALKLDSEVGTLEPGKAADIVVTDVPDYRHIVYRLAHNPVAGDHRRRPGCPPPVLAAGRLALLLCLEGVVAVYLAADMVADGGNLDRDAQAGECHR